MVGSSLDTVKPPSSTLKFLCSYGGKILPRYPDGKLRYHGGETRVLAVDSSISFSELLLKLGELCGTKVSQVRCQLPTEDLDALVSIKSDEDLANLMEEYNQSTNQKIRVFILLPNKKPSFSSSSTSSSSSSSSSSNSYAATIGSTASSSPRCINHHHQMIMSKPAKRMMIHHPHPHHHAHHHPPHYGYQYGNPSNAYMVHNGNHWQ